MRETGENMASMFFHVVAHAYTEPCLIKWQNGFFDAFIMNSEMLSISGQMVAQCSRNCRVSRLCSKQASTLCWRLTGRETDTL